VTVARHRYLDHVRSELEGIEREGLTKREREIVGQQQAEVSSPTAARSSTCAPTTTSASPTTPT
jgi:hypothetical protein